MSETTNCEDCGRPFELHRKFLSDNTKSYCHIPDTRHWYISKPAVPAVPAQEAPRGCNLAEIPGHDCAVDACEPSEPQAGAQELGEQFSQGMIQNLRRNVAEEKARLAGAQVPQKGPWKVIEDADFSGSKDYPFMIVLDRGAGPCEPNVVASRMSKANADLIVAQAGAQVPSQDEIGSILVAAIDRHITDESLRDLAVIAANGIYWRNQRIGELETHLNTIKSYATEAAKTPIAREDMHDPLKAQTFYDEAKGFERLVLSEIGGGK